MQPSLKDIWKVETDLLKEFQRVCEKYSIKYIASGGTMIGVARHKGFIPWDDDVDLMMERSEYNKLLSHSEEFTHPYFLQTWQNDKGYFRCFARLRNSETTAIQKSELGCKYPYNQGVFIDIFPMDVVIDDAELLQQQSKRANSYLKKALFYSSFKSRYYKDKNPLKRIIRQTIRTCFSFLMNDEKYLSLYEKECQKYNNTSSNTLSLLSFQFDNRKHDILKQDIEQTVYMDFEDIKIPMPKDYDRLLTHKYGDWKTPVKMPNYHGDIFFDLDKPYTYYIKEKS
ncbi:MAG: LicD family protein [Bacteroidales bacterium]|nr:LicD family protein [Bacteroidales bacterium]